LRRLDHIRVISHRQFYKRIDHILRAVEAGESVRITMRARPVADLVPLRAQRRSFVPKAEILRLVKRTPLDPNFSDDIEGAVGPTIEEL
jgi:prevent-host-death family protein